MANIQEKLKEALEKRAYGYDYDEKEAVVDRNGNATGKVKIRKKHMPPDLNAILMLKNMIDDGKI